MIHLAKSCPVKLVEPVFVPDALITGFAYAEPVHSMPDVFRVAAYARSASPYDPSETENVLTAKLIGSRAALTDTMRGIAHALGMRAAFYRVID